jgi:hypothetical protein
MGLSLRAKHYYPSLLFSGKARAYSSGALILKPFLAMSENIIIGLEWFALIVQFCGKKLQS